MLLLLGAAAARADDAYDRYRQPEKLVAALGLARGQRVADVGAGGGYLTVRLAAAVGPDGRVVATDVDDKALDVLRGRVAKLPNVVVRKVAPDEPALEAAGFDLVLLSEVDQYLPDRTAYFRKLRAALAPRGRIAVTNRNRFRDPVVAAAAAAGYTVSGEMNEIPAQFLLFLTPKDAR